VANEYPIAHLCIVCGAEVLQHDGEVPPWVLWGPGWLCAACKAAHDAERETARHREGRQMRGETRRWEANDRWEEGQ
jgi:hypothetical protein